MKLDNSPATKSDVEDAIREITPGIVSDIVVRVVGGAKTEILSAVGDQFDIVNDGLDNLETTTGRIETRLENVDRKLGEHEVRIEKLEHKPA